MSGIAVMDGTERLVEQYLQRLNIGRVTFKPDGNIPPDFSLNGSIGVEARRLNQNYEKPVGLTEGLEELAVPLSQRIKSLLRTLAPSMDGECWYVHMRFSRPLGRWRTLRVQVRQQLLAFMHSTRRVETTLAINQNFKLVLRRAGKDHGSFFILGGYSDHDSGGWIMSEVERNLRLCIAEKERKIAPHRAHYAEWWLVLEDRIDYGMEQSDRNIFRAEVMPRIPHTFNKIVLLDPRDYQRAFEV